MQARLRSVLVGGISLVALAVTAAAAPATAGPRPAPCGIAPFTPPAGAASVATVDGVRPYEEWIAGPAGQHVNETVARDVAGTFGVDTKADNFATLRAGLIGVTVDHATQSIVVVVDRSFRGTQALRDRLAAASRVTGGGPAVRVQAGCFDASELLAAADVLLARRWHPDAARASFAFGLEPDDSTFHIGFDERYPEAAEALRRQLGRLAVVTLDQPSRAGRLDDGEPHFGGAGVRVGSGNAGSNYCTTGFVVIRNSDGRRGGVSAGHCFDNGDAIHSGPQFWGTAAGENQYPAYDQIGIFSASERYINKIHVDPCCPTERVVTGAANAAVNATICHSGMTTRAICGLRVTKTNGVFCDEAGCTQGLLVARRNGDIIARGGDSGGPVYTKPGSNSATIRGMLIASKEFGAEMYAEHVSHILNHLGVRIATS